MRFQFLEGGCQLQCRVPAALDVFIRLCQADERLREIINRESLPGNVKNARCLTVQDVVMTAVRQVIGQALELVVA